jgi:hypothetical protein
MALLGGEPRAHAGFISLANSTIIAASTADDESERLETFRHDQEEKTLAFFHEQALQPGPQTVAAHPSSNGGASANVPAALLPVREAAPPLHSQFHHVLHQPSLPDPALSSIFHPPRCR